SYWVFLAGAILMHLGFLLRTVPDAGWFSYANLTERAYTPSGSVDFWVVGLQVLGVASMAAGLNFLITIVQLRAPGMSLMRMPLFGYPFMVYAVASIAFLSFTVWAHHMFTTGLGPIATSFFAASTMLIAVPTGVKIFNWISTVYGGSLSLQTPVLFALGFVALF